MTFVGRIRPGPLETAATTDVNVASRSNMAQHRPDGRTPSKQPTKRQKQAESCGMCVDGSMPFEGAVASPVVRRRCK